MKRDLKSIIYIVAYYRSLLILIPINLIAAILCIVNLNKTIDNYPKVEGIISTANLEWNKAPYNIKLEEYPKQWYVIYPSEYYSILQEKAIKGKHATIWYAPIDNNIEQLIIDGEVLRPFHKNIGLWLILLLVSLLITLFNVIYIIQNPSHAKGEKGYSGWFKSRSKKFQKRSLE